MIKQNKLVLRKKDDNIHKSAPLEQYNNQTLSSNLDFNKAFNCGRMSSRYLKKKEEKTSITVRV